MEPVSRKRTCKVGPRRFIPQYRQNKIGLVTVRKLNKPTPTTTCVLLVHRIYTIDLAHDATVLERSRNSKFSTHHQDQSMEILATREGEYEHLHTLEDLNAEALQERGWWSRTRSDSDRGRSDLSAEWTAPPRSTHVQPRDVSSFLIQQGERRS